MIAFTEYAYTHRYPVSEHKPRQLTAKIIVYRISRSIDLVLHSSQRPQQIVLTVLGTDRREPWTLCAHGLAYVLMSRTHSQHHTRMFPDGLIFDDATICEEIKLRLEKKKKWPTTPHGICASLIRVQRCAAIRFLFTIPCAAVWCACTAIHSRSL